MPIIEPPEIIVPEPSDVLTTLREFSGRLFAFKDFLSRNPTHLWVGGIESRAVGANSS